MNKHNQMGVVFAILAAFLFGAAAPLSKPLLEHLNDFQLAGMLYLGAALGVTIILLKEKSFHLPWQMARKDAIKLLGAVLFGGILGPVFLLAGLRIATAGSVSLWLNLEMVATAVIGYLIFKDHLSSKGWLAALGILAASSLLVWGEGIAGFKAGGLTALACICWGLDNHLTALIDGVSPAQSTFWKGLVAGSTNLIIGLLISPFLANGFYVVGALGLGVFSYGISIVLYITSAQYLGATRAQLFFSSAPFFGLFLALILGETPTIYQGIALLIFIGSTFLLFRESHSHIHTHPVITHTHTHDHPDIHHVHPHENPSKTAKRHTHPHQHQPLEHSHTHLPDLHHRHDHD